MNPIEIEIILMRDFDFHGFSRYAEGPFTVLCRNIPLYEFRIWDNISKIPFGTKFSRKIVPKGLTRQRNCPETMLGQFLKRTISPAFK